jgi:hypothetical protein
MAIGTVNVVAAGTLLGNGAHVLAVNNLTPGTSLLTATTFAVANTSGNFEQFACVEMDDAIIGKARKKAGIADPVQNAALPTRAAGAGACIRRTGSIRAMRGRWWRGGYSLSLRGERAERYVTLTV